MQTGQVNSLVSCIKKTYKADGIKGFFYGISSPLSSIPLVTAVVFSAYEQANWFLSAEKSYTTGMIAGSYAGLVNCIILTPVELTKCKLQAQSKDPKLGRSALYKSSFDCASQVFRQEGLRGLYKGNVITILREVPAYAFQFASYEFSKNLLNQALGVEESPMWVSFLSGMIGGFNCWLWSYPQDVVKTQLQVNTHLVLKKAFDGGAWQITKQIFKNSGWRGFWVGFSPTAIRAAVANGCGFLTYETSIRFLKGN